ncbi:MAG TPA: DinB family protein [Anaerolineales bacterium]|jgi:uncharacterized damage-inducible protein DinB|nr:DinB family protein [Anaerolineales bacterium]
MEPFFHDLLNRFDALHEDIKKSIHGLSPEALDWMPAGETNSINVLVTHLAAAEKFWAVDIPLGKDSDRERPKEFLVSGLQESELIQILDTTLEELVFAFEKMTVADLEQMRHSKQHQKDMTAGWAILHALEHTAIHVGQIQLTVQILERTTQDET